MASRETTDHDSRLAGNPNNHIVISATGDFSNGGLVPVENERFSDKATVPSDLPEVVNNENHLIPLHSDYESGEQEIPPTVHSHSINLNAKEEVTRKGAVLCGLSRRACWIVIIMITVIIIASMVGGLVGGLTN